jgi:sterol desaturase/sphingolipid hydroxylase (fatty acid hydroxylase superfamily)
MKDYLRNERGRMFESNFFEFFSKVHPATPFVLYLPVVLGLYGWALYTGLTSLLVSLVFFPLGWVGWQAMEYFLHKGFFHWEGNGPFTRRLHDIVHGYHHKYPDDDSRLVMPIGASLPVIALVGFLLYLLGQPAMTMPFFIGMWCGYLWYDFTHWSTHYRKPLTKWGKEQRSHHMAHHFADSTKNFGISFRWMDLVLGTAKKRDANSKD